MKKKKTSSFGQDESKTKVWLWQVAVCPLLLLFRAFRSPCFTFSWYIVVVFGEVVFVNMIRPKAILFIVLIR